MSDQSKPAPAAMMFDVPSLQMRLTAAGYPVGAPDGAMGPLTWTALLGFIAGHRLPSTDLGAAMATWTPQFAITTPLRIAHFLANACVETGGFRYTREIWGPTDAQRGYEGRADLGNTATGDGHRYLGRGVFQFTGRDNYDRYGKMIGLDLIAHPEIAEQADVAVHLACLYWQQHRLNAWADNDDIRGTANGINRGNPASLRDPNGFPERKAALARAKEMLP
jgi:putative chitinase